MTKWLPPSGGYRAVPKENDWVAENRALERKEAMRDWLEDHLDTLGPRIQHFALICALLFVIEIVVAVLVLVPAGVVFVVVKVSESVG